MLCRLAGVSISGYYKYKKRKILKKTKDHDDVEKIKRLVLKHKRKYGYRMITMLLKANWIIFNHKKVYRIMKKYNLLSIVRKKSVYRNIYRSLKEHNFVKNILNREFSWGLPFEKLWTDISYLKYKWRIAYLSIIKDMISWEIVWHDVSGNQGLILVQKTLKKFKKKASKLNIDISWSIMHSDQWMQYTHKSFKQSLLKLGLVQSMSRRWNCIDNAPTESFFWHLKDEVNIAEYSSLKELEYKINSYIRYYNNVRPQRNRKKMTPVQYRDHLLELKA